MRLAEVRRGVGGAVMHNLIPDRALARARELQDTGMPCFQARCQAANELGCSVGDVNTAYAREGIKLRAAKEQHDKEVFEAKRGKPVPQKPSQQIEMFAMFNYPD